MLPVDCRPRGFSPPRRFGLQLRSGNVAPLPDRIHIVSSSLQSPLGPWLDTIHRRFRCRTLSLYTDPSDPSRSHPPRGGLDVPHIQPTQPPKRPPCWTDGCRTVIPLPKRRGRRIGTCNVALPDVRAPYEERHSHTASTHHCVSYLHAVPYRRFAPLAQSTRQTRPRGLPPCGRPNPGLALPRATLGSFLPWASGSPPRTVDCRGTPATLAAGTRSTPLRPKPMRREHFAGSHPSLDRVRAASCAGVSRGVCPTGAVAKVVSPTEVGVVPSRGLHGVLDVKERSRQTSEEALSSDSSVITGFPGVVCL